VPVDAPGFSRGNSPAGVEQLIGNTAEWTATPVVGGGHIIKWQETWNGLDPEPALALMGVGFQEDVVSADDSLTPEAPPVPDSETGFRCVETTR